MNQQEKISDKELQQMGADQESARQIATILHDYGDDPRQCWEKLTKNALHPDMPGSLHQALFRTVYNQDEKFSDGPPAWFPDEATVENANLTSFMKKLELSSYRELHHYSVTNRVGFWQHMIEELNILFDKDPDQIADFDKSFEHPHWLPGAHFNIANACFQAPNDQPAIIYGTEDGSLHEMSYGQLNALSNRVANGLAAMGFRKGDRAAIDMPMTAEAVAIYLGIVKIGGAVVSIADSLAPAEVEKRLRIANTKLVFTQDIIPRGGKDIPLYQKLLDADLPQAIVLPGKEEVEAELRNNDITWSSFLADDDQFTTVPCVPEDFCNILFSSGTTGEPKAIPWTHSTPIKGAADGYLHQDIQQGEVVAWPTNIGWMMGPWLIFAGFVNRATIALFYGAPTSRSFGEFVQNARVNMLGLVPGMVKRWLESDCMKGLDWSSIKVYSSTGESSNPQDYLWLMARAGYRPVIEYCGGTEIGGGYFTGTVLQPASPSTFTTTNLGVDVVILDDDTQPADAGELFIVPPSIGLSNSLLNKDHHKVYYADLPKPDPNWQGAMGTPLGEQTHSLGYQPVLRRHGDEVKKLANGYFRAHGRADDTMNLGGIKTSSVEIERLLDLVEGVKETAAVAVKPPTGGPNQLVVYCVQAEGANKSNTELKNEFQSVMKKQLNPLFKVSDVVIKNQLPRTASNKVMRRVLRDEYEKKNR